jgi:hypothetical protein
MLDGPTARACSCPLPLLCGDPGAARCCRASAPASAAVGLPSPAETAWRRCWDGASLHTSMALVAQVFMAVQQAHQETGAAGAARPPPPPPQWNHAGGCLPGIRCSQRNSSAARSLRTSVDGQIGCNSNLKPEYGNRCSGRVLPAVLKRHLVHCEVLQYICIPQSSVMALQRAAENIRAPSSRRDRAPCSRVQELRCAGGWSLRPRRTAAPAGRETVAVTTSFRRNRVHDRQPGIDVRDAEDFR